MQTRNGGTQSYAGINTRLVGELSPPYRGDKAELQVAFGEALWGSQMPSSHVPGTPEWESYCHIPCPQSHCLLPCPQSPPEQDR